MTRPRFRATTGSWSCRCLIPVLRSLTLNVVTSVDSIFEIAKREVFIGALEISERSLAILLSYYLHHFFTHVSRLPSVNKCYLREGLWESKFHVDPQYFWLSNILSKNYSSFGARYSNIKNNVVHTNFDTSEIVWIFLFTPIGIKQRICRGAAVRHV